MFEFFHDSKDVPDTERDVLIFVDDEFEGEKERFFDVARYINGRWLTNYDLSKHRNITKWCELPPFPETKTQEEKGKIKDREQVLDILVKEFKKYGLIN